MKDWWTYMIGFMMLFGLLSLEISLFLKFSKTKTVHLQTIRNLRVAILMLMLLLILIGVMTWSFRYYGLTILLVIMIVINHMKLLKEKNEQKPHPYVVNIKKSIRSILLFVFVILPSLIFPEYKPLQTTGVYAVEQQSFVIEDENRIETFSSHNNFRQVSIRAWYPKQEATTFPLVIYSHGGISLDTSNESLYLELASHGYVVFSIGHHYHSIVSKDMSGHNVWINNAYMSELNNENATENPEESFRLYQKWMQLRTDDLNFVIEDTKIKSQNAQSFSIYHLIDSDKIAVVGHSLGGSAALCIAKTRSDVSAVIALESPYMCDIIGVSQGAFIIDDAIYSVPMLNVYSDSTWYKLSTLPQYEQNKRMLKDHDDIVVNIHIDGTGHFSLTDLSLTSPLMTRMLNGFRSTRKSKEVLSMINEVSLNFINQHLKNEK